jgi:histidinol-phosphate aminotransferase
LPLRAIPFTLRIFAGQSARKTRYCHSERSLFMTLERPNIARMHGYTPGEQPDAATTIKLNTNENPYPPSPQVAAALAAIDIASLRRYPPPLATPFRQAASAYHGISPDNIVATNGGDELLRLAITTFVDSGETIVTTQPSYSLYPVLADVQSCQLVELPLDDDWRMPLDFLAGAIAAQAKMIILVNPHAPTGRLLPASYLAQLASAFSGVLLIDEAYVDFVDPKLGYDSIALIREHENILILRTMSKGYSLAGLRFGYGIGAASLINPMLYKTRDSYNTDFIAQRLATAAIESVDYARNTWRQVREQRTRLREGLNALGLTTGDSQSNFLLATIPEPIGAETLYQQLKARHILVRYFDQPRLRDKLRITVGSAEENQTLLQTLRGLLGQ